MVSEYNYSEVAAVGADVITQFTRCRRRNTVVLCRRARKDLISACVRVVPVLQLQSTYVTLCHVTAHAPDVSS